MTASGEPRPETNNDYPHKHHKYANRVSTWALSVAVLAAVFAWWQGHLIGEANNLTRQNNIVSQRAFVSIGVKDPSIVFGNSGAINGQSILQAISQGNSEIGGINLTIELTNSGNTGTKNLLFFAKCALSSEDMQEPWSILYQGVRNPEKTPQFIGPHATIQSLCGYQIEVLRSISEGKQFAYVMVDVIYRDRLDESVLHKTQSTTKLARIGFRQAPGPSGSLGTNAVDILFAGYGRHNCADEECPE